MRLLHLYNIFGAATERAWLDYPSALQRRGHDLTFAAEQTAPQCPGITPPVVLLPRTRVEPTDDVAAQMERIASSPSLELESLLEQTWDVVHGHFGPRLLHAAPFIARGVPAVISLYGYDLSRLPRDPCWIERYRWAAQRGVQFVVLCDAMRRRLIDWGIDAACVHVIHLGVDPAQWPYQPARPAPPRFVFAGRLVEKKAPLIFLEAFAIAATQRPDLTADLIGSGPMEEAVQAATRGLHLSERVRLHGAMPREQVAATIAGATAFVLPSITARDGDSEGTPIVLMEAQALGTPCITTHHAGNAEVIAPEGRSFIVPERDAAALANAMIAIADLGASERQRLQLAGRRWIEQQFNVHATTLGYEQLYRDLAASRVAPAQP